MAMQPTAAVILALLALAPAAGAASPAKTGREPAAVKPAKPAPAPAKKPPAIPIGWQANLDAAKDEAARTGRCVLIFFHAQWSQPCRWMNEGTFASPKVARYINQTFVPIRVDDSAGTSAATKEYEVRVYPTMLFLDPGGKPLHMVLGPRPPEAFHPLLKQVADLPGLMVAREHKPSDLEANFALGNAFAVLNQLKRGAPYLERAAQLAPKNENGRLSQARLILAVVPLEDGDSQAALRNVAAYLKEFKDAPEVPVAIWYQGTILFQDEKLEDARPYFVRLRRDFPKHRKAYEADKAIEAIDARLKAKKAEKAQPPKKAQPAPPKPKQPPKTREPKPKTDAPQPVG